MDARTPDKGVQVGNRLTLTEESRRELNEVLALSLKELKSFFESEERKATPRAKFAMGALSHYARLHQSENGAQRILIMAISQIVDDPDQRKAYIQASMPLLNLSAQER